MQIICKIENLNKPNYPVINIRKLYQVVFWESDFQEFQIYTAIVLGAETNNNRQQLKSDFNVQFSFSVKNKYNEVNEIQTTFENITDRFLVEPHGWKAVWGEESKVFESQNNLNDEYNYLFSSEIKFSDSLQNDYILIKDRFKSNPNKTKTSIAYRASTLISNNLHHHKIQNSKELLSGIEVFCWTKSIIRIPEKIKNYLDYSLELCNCCNFNCYDTSIYFIPPSGFKVDRERLSIFTKGEAENIENLGNPLQQVDKNEDKYFSEWIRDLSISDRNIYRVIANDLREYFDKENTQAERLDFALPISNFVNPILIQFLCGLLVSLFFAYGLDQTRLMYYRKLFFCYELISPDFNFVFTFGTLTLSSIIKLFIGSVKENSFSYMSRAYGLFFSLLWFLWMFLICASIFYRTAEIPLKPNEFGWFEGVSWSLNLMAFGYNLIGLILVWAFHKENITFSVWEHILKLFSRNK